MPETPTDQVKAQQAALLQAIAEQGSRGAAIYQQQQDANAAQRQAAVQTALERAQNLGGPGDPGAPVSLQTQLAAQAAKPADERAAYLTSGQGSFAQDQAALTGANDTYMNQLQAAIPLVTEHANQSAAAQQRELAVRQQLAQMDLERARLGLEGDRLGLEGQRAALARAQQPDAPSLAEQKYLDDQATAARQNHAYQSVSGPTQRAMADAIANSDSLPSAWAYVMEGIKTPAPGVTFDENGIRNDGGQGSDSAFFATYGDVDIAALQRALEEYYGVGSPQLGSGTDVADSQYHVGQRTVM